MTAAHGGFVADARSDGPVLWPGVVPPSVPDGPVLGRRACCAGRSVVALPTSAWVINRPRSNPHIGLSAHGQRHVSAVASVADRRDAERVPLEEWAPPEILVDSLYAVIGDTEQMVDSLLERREKWGLSYYACFPDVIDLVAPVVEGLAGS